MSNESRTLVLGGPDDGRLVDWVEPKRNVPIMSPKLKELCDKDEPFSLPLNEAVRVFVYKAVHVETPDCKRRRFFIPVNATPENDQASVISYVFEHLHKLVLSRAEGSDSQEPTTQQS